MSDALTVEVTISAGVWTAHEAAILAALQAASAEEGVGGEVSLLLTDDSEVASLNETWRGKAGPTNVLSFPAPENPAALLGDIAMAAEIVEKEAISQGKTFQAHACHLAVHGFLHLIGYDHMTTPEAEAMEARERAILASLGIPDPYA